MTSKAPTTTSLRGELITPSTRRKGSPMNRFICPMINSPWEAIGLPFLAWGGSSSTSGRPQRSGASANAHWGQSTWQKSCALSKRGKRPFPRTSGTSASKCSVSPSRFWEPRSLVKRSTGTFPSRLRSRNSAPPLLPVWWGFVDCLALVSLDQTLLLLWACQKAHASQAPHLSVSGLWVGDRPGSERRFESAVVRNRTASPTSRVKLAVLESGYRRTQNAWGVDVRPKREGRSKGSCAMAIDDEAGRTDRSGVFAHVRV